MNHECIEVFLFFCQKQYILFCHRSNDGKSWKLSNLHIFARKRNIKMDIKKGFAGSIYGPNGVKLNRNFCKTNKIVWADKDFKVTHIAEVLNHLFLLRLSLIQIVLKKFRLAHLLDLFWKALQLNYFVILLTPSRLLSCETESTQVL